MDKFVYAFFGGSFAMDTRAGTHMICTGFPSVFMYLLILLSGDIETNPGPFIAQQNQSDVCQFYT